MIADFYNSGSPVNFVWNDYACSTPAASFDKIQYSLASALLIKGSYAYQTLAYVDQSALEDYSPDFYWVHGAAAGAYSVTSGIYSRAFANGLVLVNPSSTVAASYNLGGSVYHTSTGLQYTGTIRLAAPQGILLHNGASTAILTGYAN